MPDIVQGIRNTTRGLASSLNSYRIFLYAVSSFIGVLFAIANGLRNHSNFYAVAVYLSRSSRSILVLTNFGFLLALCFGYVVQQIFLGPLRAAEIERLYDRLWFFVTESLLAFTIFRDEFDIPFGLMFGFLLFVKCFHWLASDRIEWMDQRPYPGPPLLFHVRMTVLFGVLWAIDVTMFLIAVDHTVTNGVGGMVLFASEYAILVASVINTVAKYLLSTYELRRAASRGGENAPPWENKSMWVFYVELATDFLKLTTYLVFFAVIITFYGLPLNILRDVYVTARSFITRLRALHRYQTATRNMDERYPNANEEELGATSDRTCIICREEMFVRPPQVDGQANPPLEGPNTTPKKLPCGHIFHFHCLRSWLERQQSCPTCRRTVMENVPLPRQPGVQENVNGLPANPGIQLAQPGLGAPQVPLAQNNGNPLGFLGRLLLGGDIPNLNGQGQLPVQNLNNNAPINAGNGVVIQYHIHYPGARQPQLLVPPPPFAGFVGPGGVWQPWRFNEGLQAVQPEPAQTHGNPTPATTQRPDPAQVDSAQSVTDPAQSPDLTPRPGEQPQAQTLTPELSDAGVNNGRQSPREAAALAALRRIGQNPREARLLNRPSGDVEQTASSSSSTREAHPSNHDLSNSSSSPSVPPASNGALNTGNPRQRSHITLPSMIPLFDFLGDPPEIPDGSSSNLGPTPAPADNPESSSRLQPRRTFRPRVFANRFDGFERETNDRLPVSHLPQHLTDEQLTVMDQLTREAIDERLRVLERVSNAVHRCVDDLLKMRSVLPPGSLDGGGTSTQPDVSSVSPNGLPQKAKETANDTTETGSPDLSDGRGQTIEGHSQRIPEGSSSSETQVL